MKSTQGAGLIGEKTTYFRLIILLPLVLHEAVTYEVHSKSSLSLLKWLVSDTNRNYMWRKMNIRPANCGKIIDIN